jgi:hypothetical protein
VKGEKKIIIVQEDVTNFKRQKKAEKSGRIVANTFDVINTFPNKILQNTNQLPNI